MDSLDSKFGTGVSTLNDDDHLKYQFIRRRTYDYYVDRSAKRFDGIIHRLAVLENFVHDLHSLLEAQDAELESLRLDKTSVRIAGRLDAQKRKD